MQVALLPLLKALKSCSMHCMASKLSGDKSENMIRLLQFIESSDERLFYRHFGVVRRKFCFYSELTKHPHFINLSKLFDCYEMSRDYLPKKDSDVGIFKVKRDYKFEFGKGAKVSVFKVDQKYVHGEMLHNFFDSLIMGFVQICFDLLFND